MADFKEKAAAGLQDLIKQEPITAPPVAETPPVEAPVKDPAPVEAPPQPKADGPSTQFIEWDKDEEPAKPTTPLDIRQLAKKVGVEAESEDDFVAKLQAQTKADPFEGLPANLKKAVEYAKKGVDPLQLLKINSVDYSQIDPVQLFEADFLSKMPDKEQGRVALDAMNPFQKQYEGLKLKQQLEYQQRMAEADLLQQVEMSKQREVAERETFKNKLSSELGKVDSIENFKVLEKHRKAIFNEIAERGENPRYKTANGYDYARQIRDTFITSNWDSLKEHLFNKAKVATLKEELNQIQNVDLKRNTERLPVNPADESIHDKINRQNLESRKPK